MAPWYCRSVFGTNTWDSNIPSTGTPGEGSRQKRRDSAFLSLKHYNAEALTTCHCARTSSMLPWEGIVSS